MSEWMEMEQAAVRYSDETPEWMEAFCRLPELQRLRDVGMNCGCEYTAFARFRSWESTPFITAFLQPAH